MSTTPRYSTPWLRAFTLWAQALSAEGNSLGYVLQTYVDKWADDLAAQPQPEPDDYAALLRHAREILVKTGTVDVPYEQLGAGFLNVGIAPRLARDLRVRFHRDEVNARMVFGTEA